MNDTTPTFARNPYYIAYETKLRQLHRLISQCKDDTDEADRLRDEMEEPFLHLTEPEQRRLNDLSGDLYQLQGREVYVPVENPAQRSRDVMWPLLRKAAEAKQWEQVLSLLRIGPDFMSQDELAFHRGYMYMLLGHLESALDFTSYAFELKPHHPKIREQYLYLLVHMGRIEEAVTLSIDEVRRSDSTTTSVYFSIWLLYVSTGGEDKSVNQILIEAFTRTSPEPSGPQMRTRAIIQIITAWCHQSLGRYKEAHNLLETLKAELNADDSLVHIVELSIQRLNTTPEQGPSTEEISHASIIPGANFATARNITHELLTSPL